MRGPLFYFLVSHMYPKEYFMERFQDDETEDLLLRYATVDLTDAAKEAILSILKKRGVSKENLGPLLKQAKKASYRQTRGSSECDYCGKSARYSKVIDGEQRFCSEFCLRDARLMEVSEDLTEQEIIKHAQEIRNDVCPSCKKRNGIVEVRKYYRIWSVLVFSRWTEHTHVCCKSCGVKKNLNSISFCFFFGWWGFPWGVLMTPVKIVSNMVEALKRDSDSNASEPLVRAARLNLAYALLKKSGKTIRDV